MTQQYQQKQLNVWRKNTNSFNPLNDVSTVKHESNIQQLACHWSTDTTIRRLES